MDPGMILSPGKLAPGKSLIAQLLTGPAHTGAIQ